MVLNLYNISNTIENGTFFFSFSKIKIKLNIQDDENDAHRLLFKTVKKKKNTE